MYQNLPVMLRIKPVHLQRVVTCSLSLLQPFSLDRSLQAHSRNMSPHSLAASFSSAPYTCMVCSHIRIIGSLPDVNHLERTSLITSPVYSCSVLFFYSEFSSFTFHMFAYCLLFPRDYKNSPATLTILVPFNANTIKF